VHVTLLYMSREIVHPSENYGGLLSYGSSEKFSAKDRSLSRQESVDKELGVTRDAAAVVMMRLRRPAIIRVRHEI
jgi:hypothetical protein